MLHTSLSNVRTRTFCPSRAMLIRFYTAELQLITKWITKAWKGVLRGACREGLVATAAKLLRADYAPNRMPFCSRPSDTTAAASVKTTNAVPAIALA